MNACFVLADTDCSLPLGNAVPAVQAALPTGIGAQHLVFLFLLLLWHRDHEPSEQQQQRCKGPDCCSPLLRLAYVGSCHTTAANPTCVQGLDAAATAIALLSRCPATCLAEEPTFCIETESAPPTYALLAVSLARTASTPRMKP